MLVGLLAHGCRCPAEGSMCHKIDVKPPEEPDHKDYLIPDQSFYDWLGEVCKGGGNGNGDRAAYWAVRGDVLVEQDCGKCKESTVKQPDEHLIYLGDHWHSLFLLVGFKPDGRSHLSLPRLI